MSWFPTQIGQLWVGFCKRADTFPGASIWETNTGDQRDDSCQVNHPQPGCGLPTELKLGKASQCRPPFWERTSLVTITLYAQIIASGTKGSCSLPEEREKGTIIDRPRNNVLIRENYYYFHLQGYPVSPKPHTFHHSIAQEKMSKLWIYCWVRNSNNVCQREVNLNKGAAGRKEKLWLKNSGNKHWTLCV